MTIYRLAVAVLCLTALSVSAQQLQLPAKSPGAKLTQTVGLTDITIEYSSPAVNARKIWGGLVPYNTVWRAGANASTKITFSKDVMIENTAVPAGTYPFLTIPGEKTWTLILSKDIGQNYTNYDKEKDLLRFTAKPAPIAMRERLAYVVSNFTDDAASIDLEWEKLKVSLPVKLKTKEQALANIQTASDNNWGPMSSAARYFLDQKMYPEAMQKVDASIAIRETWLNTWVKAQILAGQGKYKDAYPLAEKAKALGEKEPNKNDFFFAEDIKKALVEWKNKG